MINAIIFLSGITVATFLASGVFFLKFYKASGDKFYLFFCLTCWMLAIERLLILLIIGPIQNAAFDAPWVYFIRLAAFLLIFFAIYDKNRKKKKA